MYKTVTKSIDEIKEFIEIWKARPHSAQRTVVLNYWVNQAKAYVPYHRHQLSSCGESVRISNNGQEVRTAIKTLTNLFKVPQKIKGECRYTQLRRITAL